MLTLAKAAKLSDESLEGFIVLIFSISMAYSHHKLHSAFITTDFNRDTHSIADEFFTSGSAIDSDNPIALI